MVGEIFKRLLKTADVVTESFTSGYMDNLGLEHLDLSQINPQLISNRFVLIWLHLV